MKRPMLITALIIGLLITSSLVTIAFKLPVENNKTVETTEIINKVNVKTDGKDVNYMYGTATAYTPSVGGINSDDNPQVTSTMKPAKEGIIAVNPNRIPYGSEVMIIVDGTVIRGKALDTGGAMRKSPNQVDILMEDVKEAKKWGRKEAHIIWW